MFLQTYCKILDKTSILKSFRGLQTTWKRNLLTHWCLANLGN